VSTGTGQVHRARDRHYAERRLDHVRAAVERSSQLPAFQAFAEGIRQWRSELLAYFDQPATNGYAEGVINKVIKRRAYGLPSFDGFRERVLLARSTTLEDRAGALIRKLPDGVCEEGISIGPLRVGIHELRWVFLRIHVERA
jgi:hypothetical protein